MGKKEGRYPGRRTAYHFSLYLPPDIVSINFSYRVAPRLPKDTTYRDTLILASVRNQTKPLFVRFAMSIKDILKPKGAEEIRQNLDSMSIVERLELIKKLESDIGTYEARLDAYRQDVNWEGRDVTEVIEELKELIRYIEDSFK